MESLHFSREIARAAGERDKILQRRTWIGNDLAVLGPSFPAPHYQAQTDVTMKNKTTTK